MRPAVSSTGAPESQTWLMALATFFCVSFPVFTKCSTDWSCCHHRKQATTLVVPRYQAYHLSFVLSSFIPFFVRLGPAQTMPLHRLGQMFHAETCASSPSSPYVTWHAVRNEMSKLSAYKNETRHIWSNQCIETNLDRRVQRQPAAPANENSRPVRAPTYSDSPTPPVQGLCLLLFFSLRRANITAFDRCWGRVDCL
jgi:hypothetical protein